MPKLKRRDFLRLTGHSMLAGSVCAGVRPVGARPRFRSDPFTLGVASGYPTPDGLVLWTRLAPSPLEPNGGMPPDPVAVRWEVASDPAMRQIVSQGTEYATSDWAFSVHAEPRGLTPARDYWYRFTAGDAVSRVGRTRTAPAATSSPARLRVALASCQQYEHGYYSAYRHMLADELDLIVHVGDYIYELSWGESFVRQHDGGEAYTLEDYRRRHALYRSDADLAAAHAACAWLVTWDDHEVDNDYADATSEQDDEPQLFLARRAAAYRAFYEHMPLPRASVPFAHNMRLYTQRAFGDLAMLYMLDARQYRSPHACPREGQRGANRVSACAALEAPERTLLGERQERWLNAKLASSRARWNLVAQGVVMSHMDEDPGEGHRYWTDSWNGYPQARRRLLAALAERRVANPIVLSGDIHTFVTGTLNEVPDDPRSRPVGCELVTTSISSQGVPQELVDTIRTVNPNIAFISSEHRGYMRLDLTPSRLQADLIGLEDVKRRDSGRQTIRSFVIENARSALVDA